MSFLQVNDSEYLSARITNLGRKRIAQGNFNIKYFQIGDSEFDYNYNNYDGVDNRPHQKVLSPFDKDCVVKYPYKVSDSTITGSTYGNAVQFSQTEIIKNNIGAAGNVTEYIPYDSVACEGTKVKSNWVQIDISAISGTTELIIPSGSTFFNTKYITIYFDTLFSTNSSIKKSATSLVYKIVSVVSGSTYNKLILDRPTPNLSTLSPKSITIIDNEYSPFTTSCNTNCSPLPLSPLVQQDSWNMNVVWGQKPAGMDYAPDSTGLIEDERLSGYTSNVFVSTKEFFGYTSSKGQLTNTGTTITNSSNESIVIPPEEQKCLAILHYTKLSDLTTDPELSYKYDDYLSHSIDSGADGINTDVDYFNIYIPFLYYHRNTGTTIGARFFMGKTDYYINSSAIDSKLNKIKYRYLIDEQGVKVGKIFVNHKVIVFDDEEIVAALEYKSNRRYTLPAPKASLVPIDIKCNENVQEPLLSGTGTTVFISYGLFYTGDTKLNGLHCNYYNKLTGTTINSDASIKFSTTDFSYLKNTLSGVTDGFIANKFCVLIQKVNAGTLPNPALWRIIDMTSQIPNHTVGNLISATNLSNKRFIIHNDDYENANLYDLESYLQPSIGFPNESTGNTINLFTPEFGDEQPFNGSIRVTRASDLEVMRFLVNLPSNQFLTTQNPTYSSTKTKKITEIVLLDDNKDVLVVSKTPRPITRVGTQVFAVKLDF